MKLFRVSPVALVIILISRLALAGTAAQSDPAMIEARALFKRGQSAYDTGDYQSAIDSFRKSYEISNAPGLLFNIAQSFRLMGDCFHAIETYRHFLRRDDHSVHRSEAETLMAELEPTCHKPALDIQAPPSAEAVPPPLVSVPVPSTPALVSVVPDVEQNRAKDMADSKEPISHRDVVPRWVSWSAGGLSMVLGVTAVAFHLDNQSNYSAWLKENDQLARGPGPFESMQQYQNRQDINDERLHKIDRRDDLVLGLAIGAVAVGAAAILVHFLK